MRADRDIPGASATSSATIASLDVALAPSGAGVDVRVVGFVRQHADDDGAGIVVFLPDKRLAVRSLDGIGLVPHGIMSRWLPGPRTILLRPARGTGWEHGSFSLTLEWRHADAARDVHDPPVLLAPGNLLHIPVAHGLREVEKPRIRTSMEHPLELPGWFGLSLHADEASDDRLQVGYAGRLPWVDDERDLLCTESFLAGAPDGAIESLAALVDEITLALIELHDLPLMCRVLLATAADFAQPERIDGVVLVLPPLVELAAMSEAERHRRVAMPLTSLWWGQGIGIHGPGAATLRVGIRAAAAVLVGPVRDGLVALAGDPLPAAPRRAGLARWLGGTRETAHEGQRVVRTLVARHFPDGEPSDDFRAFVARSWGRSLPVEEARRQLGL